MFSAVQTSYIKKNVNIKVAEFDVQVTVRRDKFL